MILHRQGTRKTRAPRPRRGRERWVLERLEVRALLSGSPTVYTVNTTSSANVGSGSTGTLVYAIDQANANTNPAGSVIQFDPSLFNTSSPQTITLSNTLALTGTAGPIVINGPDATGLSLPNGFPVTVSGNNAVRVFTIATGVTATLSGLGITSGLSSGTAGGVLNGGNLTLSDCEISQSTAVVSGGGIVNDGSMTINSCVVVADKAEAATGEGGGIANYGTMALEDSEVGDCEETGANGYGGCIYNSGSLQMQSSVIGDSSVSAGFGGGLYNNGTASISLSIIASNSTGTGGAGGGVFNVGHLTVLDSLVAANSTGGYGGGIANELALAISYSTINQNTASTQGGGIFNGDMMQAVNLTIAGNIVNSASGGGGLYSGVTTSTIINTIVAENNQILGMIILPDDIVGTVSSSSTNNLIGTGGAGGLTNGAGANQVGVASPGLGSLTENGGDSETIALSPGSPAINFGINVPNSGTTDQRGPGFARVYNGGVDIGAYELQPGMVSAVTVGWGSAGEATLETASDGLRLLPAGRHTDLPWTGINELQIELNQPETVTVADVTITSQRGKQYGPFTVSDSGLQLIDVTIAFAHPITKADRVTITIAGPGIVTFTRRLDILPGDFNDNGVVNNQDITAIRNEWKGKNGAGPTIFGEILGDGTVTAADYHAAKKFNGTKLPKLPKHGAKPPHAVIERALARQPHDLTPRHHA